MALSKDTRGDAEMGRVVVEKILIPNNMLLLFTEECPLETRRIIQQLTEEEGDRWFIDSIRDQEYYKSRRSIFIPYWRQHDAPAPILKEKYSEGPERTRLRFTTQSVVHEIRTAKLLERIMREKDFRHTLELPNTNADDEAAHDTYTVRYRVQQPWGALIDFSSGKKYGIFEYIFSTSIRDFTYTAGGWNSLDASSRQLFGKINQLLLPIAESIIEGGMDPHDFGLIQILYSLNTEARELVLSILDTEQYTWTRWRGQGSSAWEESSLLKILVDHLFR